MPDEQSLQVTVSVCCGQIKDAILPVDDRARTTRDLTEDELTGLLQAIPTADECKLLSAYCGDARNLGEVEQFMLAMMAIPQVRFSERPFYLEQLDAVHWVPGSPPPLTPTPGLTAS